MPTPPCILTIAGSDSGGGAGIQADLKTITVIGGFGMSVITALTAQNGVGVAGIHAPEPGFVGLQLKTVREGFPIAAAKTGMLFSAEIIEAVEAGLQGREFPLVVDPVCVSQSGQRLLREDAVNALRWHILPKADLLTPNRPEAELLADMKIDSEKDIDVAARKLLDMGPKAVLIKGGHFGSASDAEFTDWLALPDEPLIALKQPGVKTSNNHGTGCTLSAAIATYLGLGLGIREAIVHAQKFLNHCLRHGYAPGLGAGPRKKEDVRTPLRSKCRFSFSLFSAVSLVPLSREIRFPAHGRFIVRGNAALPSMPICFIFFYYDDIRSLSPLAAMRPLLSRTDLDQPALSLPPHVFVFSLFVIRASPRSVCACAPQDDGVFYVFCIACEALVFLVLCHRFRSGRNLGDEDVPTRRLVARPQRGAHDHVRADRAFILLPCPRRDRAPHRRRLCVLGRPRAYDDHPRERVPAR